MKIGIVAPAPVPAVVGGAERLWRGLRDGLIRRGHEANLCTIDFPETTLLEVLEGYQRFSELDVSQYDMVITGKYPAWMITHQRHLVYMLHPLRGLYDTYPAQLGALTSSPLGRQMATSFDGLDGPRADPIAVIECARQWLDKLSNDDPLGHYPGPLARYTVQLLDRIAFAPTRVRRFAAISHEVADRPNYFPPLAPVLVAHPESDLPRASETEASAQDTVFFTASRLDGPKRIDLIIESFRLLKDRPARLIIAGDGPDKQRLLRCAGTDHRIEFLGRISEEELAARYQQASAVVFVPDREDFGYISLEALRAGTPVITTTDSGGAKELLAEGVGGIVVEPTRSALASAMATIADDPLERWLLGLNGQRRARTADWSELWRAIEDLDPGSKAERPRVIMMSTFAITPTIGGGQRRVRHLARQLARHADVTVLALSGNAESVRRRTVELGIDEIVVPRTSHHRDAEAEITRIAGLPVDDITCAELWPASPQFAEELDRLLPNADAVVLSHPFLSTVLRDRIGSTPVIYDSHNAESDFKSSVLGDDDAANWLTASVRASETYAIEQAQAVTVCTTDDAETLRALVSNTATPFNAARFTVVPNGVDASALPLRTARQHSAARAELLALVKAGSTGESDTSWPHVAVFLGSWHPPNLDAARLILEASRLRPDWLFVLAGSHTISLESTGYNNVRLMSTFAEESLFPLLAGADVALNPMVTGGGSNLKLYDYLAVGTPVLTTDIGARGLDLAERYVLCCDPTADGLSEGLLQILRDPDAQSERTSNGRKLVESAVNWTTLGDQWASVVLGVIQAQPKQNSQPSRPARPSPPPPLLATSAPPHHDPTIDLMSRVASAALDAEPPKDLEFMDPTIRENLQLMASNKMAGQEIPTSARLRVLKQIVARASKLVTNEQVVFNDAAVEAITALTAEVQTLAERVSELENEHDNVTPTAGSEPE